MSCAATTRRLPSRIVLPRRPGRRRPGGWRWLLPVLLLLAGCLIFCHGCHRGGHDVDDELSVVVPDGR